MSLLSREILDAILGIQLGVAWAGEGRSEPPRLGWWDTDLVDPAGGGDLLARLLPQTHAWASLEAVRDAALRVDAAARGKMASPDAVRSLFFLGFEIDEQVNDRLAALKRSRKTPADALRFPVSPAQDFAKDAFAKALESFHVAGATTIPDPAGRRVKGPMPDAPDAIVRRLAFALLPLEATYPLPFFKLQD